MIPRLPAPPTHPPHTHTHTSSSYSDNDTPVVGVVVLVVVSVSASVAVDVAFDAVVVVCRRVYSELCWQVFLCARDLR